jgi:hypothetical protein
MRRLRGKIGRFGDTIGLRVRAATVVSFACLAMDAGLTILFLSVATGWLA